MNLLTITPPTHRPPPPPTRAEHLAWCRRRALAFLDAGDLTNAVASMQSDLSKHPLTQGHIGIAAGTFLLIQIMPDTAAYVRQWIEGFR